MNKYIIVDQEFDCHFLLRTEARIFTLFSKFVSHTPSLSVIFEQRRFFTPAKFLLNGRNLRNSFIDKPAPFLLCLGVERKIANSFNEVDVLV